MSLEVRLGNAIETAHFLDMPVSHAEQGGEIVSTELDGRASTISAALSSVQSIPL